MKMPWKNEPNVLSMLIAIGMTLIGAVASYSFKVLNGEAFSWRTLFLQLIVSIFAGLTMVMIALHYAWPQEIMGGVCGMAGWSGASLIKALERRFLNKASGGENAGQ
ncbi:phage holin family protein [Serratia proteamaculans]|uniref:Holin n=1 Tax=Serratia proteamaculans TaxID=28151 RepID=A0A5Q2VHL0_SERPR|nr:phage holin family protein [Serratia proteamaculans]QGH63415.1 holin [Serratia proteamaculans]